MSMSSQRNGQQDEIFEPGENEVSHAKHQSFIQSSTY